MSAIAEIVIMSLGKSIYQHTCKMTNGVEWVSFLVGLLV